LIVTYVIALMPAVFYTQEVSETAEWFDDLLSNVLMFAIVLLLSLLVGRPWLIAATVVLTLATVGAMTIVNQLLLGAEPSSFLGFATVSPATGEMITTPRHAGPLTDANFWGRNLILGLPVSYALTHRSMAAGRHLPLLGWLLTSAVLLVSIYLTQSRGALIAAIFATVVWVVMSGPRVRRSALVATPVLGLLLLVPGVGNRLLGLDSILSDTPTYAMDSSLVGRAVVQEIAAVIFAENPLFGVGPDAFDSVVPEYTARAGNAVIGEATAPHNLYLEAAAETGLVGLVGLALLSGGIVAIGVGAVFRLSGARTDGRLGSPTRSLAAGATAAVLGWLAASAFLHMEYFQTLLIIFALVSSIDHCGAKAAGDSPDALADGYRRAIAGARRGLLAALVVCLVAVQCGVILLLAGGVPRFSTQVSLTLLPSSGTYIGYAMDVRSRVPVLPAYGAMIHSSISDKDLHIVAEPRKGILTMTGYGRSRADAEQLLESAVAGAPAALARYRADKQYELVVLTPPVSRVETTYPADAIAVTVLGGLLELAIIRVAFGYLRRRPKGISLA
jgi:O-antigen ligase